MPDLESDNPQSTDRGSSSNQISAPSISLPKGGGAIRGIGEKFAANPVTGTGSMTVPIAASPGRSGFGPQLVLSYDSGSGNGPFGLGWSLSLPSITRKTDKGLPRYEDANDSDVFILSGAEDLVPVLTESGGTWDREALPPRVVKGASYQISRYRPRIEGLFARIERWTNTQSGDVHWRSISKDNITTCYGTTSDSRIVDPLEPTHVFSWLICESYDDRGNAIIYEYVHEDSAGIDLTEVHERNRTDQSRSVNRYLKRIKYGNVTSRLVQPDLSQTQWLFEVVFDYNEKHYDLPPTDELNQQFVDVVNLVKGDDPKADRTRGWAVRQDPFSTYRARFEVRTYRLCRRVLMFHHFPDELGVEDYLVRSTDIEYNEGPVATFVSSVTQSGYVLRSDASHPNRFLKKSLPPLEFEYSGVPTVEEFQNLAIEELDSHSFENLPIGVDGSQYQWADLDGEGLSGILSEQSQAWYYKPNLGGKFGPTELVGTMPSLAALTGGRQQLLDLEGDGRLDLVDFNDPVPGFYERSSDERWEPFTPFSMLPSIDWSDPNLRFVDLTGDGHADILITEDEVFTWYPSRAQDGFGPASKSPQALGEENAPRVVFSDASQSIVLADLSGDGLTDLVRIRNGEVCYWPNLGYGKFGAKVTMEGSPWFDSPDQFSFRRIRLADLDGSGTTDLLYLHADGIQVYFNQSGNRWSAGVTLGQYPPADTEISVQVVDLLGNGTACLVWSSSLPDSARHPLRYIKLMNQKPHLLVEVRNNLGAETVLQYASSTKFYLADKESGTPWITKLPFPVYVVEQVTTFDRINRARFDTRYAYHHGYYDGVEREFRGFGMVEQWDTEMFDVLASTEDASAIANLNEASYVPPVHLKSWFHTGVYIGGGRVSDYFAGLLDSTDRGEYYREPGIDDNVAKQALLADTILPLHLTAAEEREACRALKGSLLHQEVYAEDGTAKAIHPYAIAEQNYTIQCVQPRGKNVHAVYCIHPREAISTHSERNPSDPRIVHTMTLELDGFNNVLKQASIGYGRRIPDPELTVQSDRDRQTQTLVTYTENRYTNPCDTDDDYRAPLPCESRSYELTGYPPTDPSGRYQISDFVKPDPMHPQVLIHIFDSEINYEDGPTSGRQRRLVRYLQTRYRKNDMTDLLPLGSLEPLALTGESYKLKFTPSLIASVFKRKSAGHLDEALLPNPGPLLEGNRGDEGGYVLIDGNWWAPSGRVYYDKGIDPLHPSTTASQELSLARQCFFLQRKFVDPFGISTDVDFDPYNLLVVQKQDAVLNVVQTENDYRVVQPRLVVDQNHNRVEAAFDALGLVVATAVKGKDDTEGDTLSGLAADLTPAEIGGFFDAADPHTQAPGLLSGATTRIVYDFFAYWRTRQALPQDATQWLPVCSAVLARETHLSDPTPPGGLKIQISFSYSDGFGREIQKKMQAEPGPVVEEGPIVSPRWVGSGWTIFNNKKMPYRHYEPFFSQLPDKGHRFEFGVRAGVSPTMFYDPTDRLVVTIRPNNTYEKVVFDAWKQITYDVNDTVTARGFETGDPRTDVDVLGYVNRYFQNAPGLWKTWSQQRLNGDKGSDEKAAAEKAAMHADTPTTLYLDSLGRTILTLSRNRFLRNGSIVEEQYLARKVLDIEGNTREVRDADEQGGDTLGRVVMRYDYDMLGTCIHQSSLEAGERWMLDDTLGKTIRSWDSLGRGFRAEFDPLRRPLRAFATGVDAAHPAQEFMTERIVYGEQHPENATRNLRGQVYLHLDQSGVAANDAFDFKGNQLRATRRVAKLYAQTVDWTAIDSNHVGFPDDSITLFDPVTLKAILDPVLEIDTFANSSRFDAMNRTVQVIAPRSDQPGSTLNVIQPQYNEANLLEQISVWLELSSEPAELLDPASTPPSNVGVSNIDYDSKGQRKRIDYVTQESTVISTSYEYDSETFRLTHLYTRRGVDPTTLDGLTFTDDCDNPQPPPITIAAPEVPPDGSPCGLQNLHYTYDPVGNVTHIADSAQQTIYFRNKKVEASADFTYDAVYRVIEATGREHLGQVGGVPIPHSFSDIPRVEVPHPGDGNAMGTYIEQYLYDQVGNLRAMAHRGSDPVNAGWTRTYQYNESSLIEDGSGGSTLKTNNRVSSTTIAGSNPSLEPYRYDAHGNTIQMPHLARNSDPQKPNMQWNMKDQLQKVDLAGGGATWYVYDFSGQRVRKVTELADGSVNEERIYLAGSELYRGPDNLVRETLHITDDRKRIALVETRTQGTESGNPRRMIRYQFGNQLGSASLELDNQAQIISYEEYTPYGSSTYQAVRSQTETPKRYRFAGRERDKESGFYYSGARYLAPWLGRWISTDPIGIKDGVNLYCAFRDNPVRFGDPTGTQVTPLNFVDYADSVEAGLSEMAELGKTAEKEFGLGFDKASGRLMILEGGSKSV
jgi:RHS repeat-associated protein